jgi:ABC-type multidrug transport system permease subunit
MSFLGATFFDPGTLPAALKVVVYLLPLTYASIGLRIYPYPSFLGTPYLFC